MEVNFEEFGIDRVDSNVIYGMYSGLALLMDVYYPQEQNGIGIVHISGSGWSFGSGVF